MKPIRIEWRAHTKVDRCAEKCFTYAPSVGREVIGTSFFVDEPNCPDGPAIVVELGSDDRAIAQVFAVLIESLVEYVEVVPRTYIEHEVDVPSEDPREIHDSFVGEMGLSSAFEQRRLDSAVGAPVSDLEWAFKNFGGEVIAHPEQTHRTRQVELAGKTHQATFVMLDD